MQQTMKTASSDEELAFKQKEKDTQMPLDLQSGTGSCLSLATLGGVSAGAQGLPATSSNFFMVGLSPGSGAR